MDTERVSKEKDNKQQPSIRLVRAVLKNFKSVRCGEIVFNCGRQSEPFNNESDILGIYGQNGSGKTAFIEALSVLKELMSGSVVPSAYADCVAVGSAYAELEFTFAMRYPDETCREAGYSFCMANKKLSPDEISEKYKDAPETFDIPEEDSRVEVFNERFFLSWEKSSKRQMIIDTSTEDAIFSPVTKRRELVGGDKKVIYKLGRDKLSAREKSRSFIFMKAALDQFKQNNPDSVFYKVLTELRLFARNYLFVVDTISTGFIRINAFMPVYTRTRSDLFGVRRPSKIKEEDFGSVCREIERISIVLSQLVPGLSIGIRELARTLDRRGNRVVQAMLTAFRDGRELPLRDESDGVRKIISVLSLLIAAFNEKSVTVAIDELDAGIFEYLLGEILEAMQESGKGQFIFTSHNLRPLEVLDKKFICFTTTNPDNRFIRLKKIGSTNNLRDTYLREILVSEQDEEIYNRTKRYKIVSALKQAGGLS